MRLCKRHGIVQFVVFVALCCSVFQSSESQAQLDPTGRSGDRPREFLPGEPPKPPPTVVLPPLPAQPKEDVEKGKEAEQPREQPPGDVLPPVVPSGPRINVRKIRVIGNTVVPAEAIAKITGPYEDKALTAEDLEALRLALTRHYISKGYINSGAILPDQTVTDGIVTYRIIEGKLTDIELEGNWWFRDWFLTSRLRLGAGEPLNVNGLQEELQILLQDSNIERLNTELLPGAKRGDAVLKVKVEEQQPFSLVSEYDNYQSPTVGSNRGLVTFVDRNVTGLSDIFYIQYGRSTGLNPLIDVFYEIPFTPYDTSFMFRYRKNNYGIVEAPFDPLNIETKSDIFTLKFRQPFLRSLNQEFAVDLVGERLQSQSFLGGIRFPFTPGTDNGEAVTAPVRIGLEWLRRSAVQVIAARAQFSFGTRLLGATQNDDPSLPDANFFAWLGQAQFARRFRAPDWFFWLRWSGSEAQPYIEALARVNLQLTGDPLFPLEQIAIGGRYSVRGYRENQIIRDNGVVQQFEVRIPLVVGQKWADYVQLAPFIDVGTGWNAKSGALSQTLASIGVGFRWQLSHLEPVQTTSQFEFYWGLPLNRVSTEGGNLQDHGIHLRFAMGFF